MPVRRGHISETTKRVIASGQKWECAHCDSLLSAAFQVDHIKPLWDGGADEVVNLHCLCGSCHGLKTQREAQERAEQRRGRVRKAQSDWEDGVRKRHEAAVRVVTNASDGTVTCVDCGKSFYRIFKHACPAARQRIDNELGGRHLSQAAHVTDEKENPFFRFTMTSRQQRRLQ